MSTEYEVRPYQIEVLEGLRADPKKVVFMDIESTPNAESWLNYSEYGKSKIYKSFRLDAESLIEEAAADFIEKQFPSEITTIRGMIATMRYESAQRIKQSEPGYPFTWQVMQDKTVLLIAMINFTLPIYRRCDLKCSTAFGWVISL